MLQIKIVQNSVSYKKLTKHICVSPWSGGRGLQRLPLLKYWNGKVNLL